MEFKFPNYKLKVLCLSKKTKRAWSAVMSNISHVTSAGEDCFAGLKDFSASTHLILSLS